MPIAGAGAIGSEIAASARAPGCPVTKLEAAPTPMARLLPTRIDLERLELDGERYVTTDAVVVATGLRPRTELAEQAGIGVDDGILVDEFFSTSVPGVFAAGDVARSPT